MTEHLPGLTVLIPLIAATLTIGAAYIKPQAARGLTITALFLSMVCAAANLKTSLTEGTIRYEFAGWAPPWGIEYVIDPLSGGMAILIAFISLMVAIYAGSYLKGEVWLRHGTFYALYLLVTAGLLGMVSTGDVFNLYVFLEISSLSAYGLIASGGREAAVAAFRYLLLGTIGASLYLLGAGYLYIVTGTLNMTDMAELVQPIIGTPPVIIAMVMITLGMGIKMALYPLHGWLPDAYTYAPPPVTAFISAVMTKVSAYVFFRMAFYVLGTSGGPVPGVVTVLGWLAVIGIIMGSVMAIAQTDIRRMLAYSSVAQIGYIILGIAVGNVWGMIGALLHILNHAVMKCCLFLAVGGVKWKTGEHRISRYVEMVARMPLTMGAFLIAAFSMIGLPPTAGFFSKWYLALGAVEEGMWVFVIVLIVSSLMNMIYFFRIIEHAFVKARERDILSSSIFKKLELPATMLVPIVLFGVGILALGIFNEQIVSIVLAFSLPGGVQ